MNAAYAKPRLFLLPRRNWATGRRWCCCKPGAALRIGFGVDPEDAFCNWLEINW